MRRTSLENGLYNKRLVVNRLLKQRAFKETIKVKPCGECRFKFSDTMCGENVHVKLPDSDDFSIQLSVKIDNLKLACSRRLNYNYNIQSYTRQ